MNKLLSWQRLPNRAERIPEKFAPPDESIETMPEGEWRWSLPWALSIDMDGQGWLWPSYPAERRGPRGTLHMRVKREGAGYVVDLDSIPDEHYQRQPSGPGFGTHPVVRYVGGGLDNALHDSIEAEWTLRETRALGS